MTTRRGALQGIAAGTCAWTCGALRAVLAQQPAASVVPAGASAPTPILRAGAELMTPETHDAVGRALGFLKRRQIAQGDQRGAFGTSGHAGDVAVCGLSGLAFLAQGSSPGRGPFGLQIERCIDFLLRNTSPEGYIACLAAGGPDRMYGHGFATLFLAESYGMSPDAEQDRRLGEALRRAVRLIIDTQNDEGGWRYQPVKSDADLSITICQIMALRAARDAGLDVPQATRTKCIDYVRRCRARDGSFMYTAGGGGHGSFALTAAGVVALMSAGVYDGPEVEGGLANLKKNPPSSINDGYFFYGQYYAAQAMWHAGGQLWADWYTAIRDVLLRSQQGAGSWIDPGVGEEFGAAMGSLILQLPLNLVPVFGEG